MVETIVQQNRIREEMYLLGSLSSLKMLLTEVQERIRYVEHQLRELDNMDGVQE